jgi:hypothetical protein
MLRRLRNTTRVRARPDASSSMRCRAVPDATPLLGSERPRVAAYPLVKPAARRQQGTFVHGIGVEKAALVWTVSVGRP